MRGGVGAFRETPCRMGWRVLGRTGCRPGRYGFEAYGRNRVAAVVDARLGAGASGLVTGRFAKRPYTVRWRFAADSGGGAGRGCSRRRRRDAWCVWSSVKQGRGGVRVAAPLRVAVLIWEDLASVAFDLGGAAVGFVCAASPASSYCASGVCGAGGGEQD